MILSDLLGRPVHDAAGHRVGFVADARLALTDDGTARLHGLLVSPRPHTPFLGFERVGGPSPWPVAQLLRRLRRGTFLVLWPEVAEVAADRVRLAKGATRWSADLPADDAAADARPTTPA